MQTTMTCPATGTIICVDFDAIETHLRENWDREVLFECPVCEDVHVEKLGKLYVRALVEIGGEA